LRADGGRGYGVGRTRLGEKEQKGNKYEKKGEGGREGE
jgi:hypothetical protein